MKRVLDRTLHLYHYQWKDGFTLVCVGGSEDMDLEQLFTSVIVLIIETFLMSLVLLKLMDQLAEEQHMDIYCCIC